MGREFQNNFVVTTFEGNDSVGGPEALARLSSRRRTIATAFGQTVCRGPIVNAFRPDKNVQHIERCPANMYPAE
jgi:hypothetical protein